MDYCKYVNSKAIGKYLRDINYRFNTKEAAWLIYQCSSISLTEKHAAWRQLMADMPDFDLGERFAFLPNNSLFELIRRYIKNHENQLELFNKKEEVAIYQYRFHCSNDPCWCEDFEGIYASLEELWAAIEEDMHLGIDVIEIRKRYIGRNKTIDVRFTPSRTVMDIYSYNHNDDTALIEEGFDEMWFDFPVPFEKGDILVPAHIPGPNNLWSENGPFVMESITPWEKELNERVDNANRGDYSDMLSWGYFQDPDGRIYRECEYGYMNLEYYEGPFNGPRRLLIALSNFVKGEISIEMLLSAYRKIIMDEINDDVMLHSWYSEDTLRKCGLEDVIEENNHRLVESGLNPNIHFSKRYYDDTDYNWDNNTELVEKCHDLAGNYHQPKEMLFIYGKNGCGKTTLLNALGNYAKQLSRPNLLYVTAENFVNEVIMAIRGNKLPELREKYRSLSWLIVDDIQFLCGKESSMEEFTHTLNDLLAKGAQVVISSDRPLDELDFLEALMSKLSFATRMEMKGFSDTNMLVEQIKNDWDEIKESIKESGNLASIPFDNCIAPLEIGGLIL